ncbi:hypothetical protein [Ensifer adhaerens]|uniref:Antitoxin VbhA domain-containing protein n=1 Tax=Ensifer adhaerens TaxID=106592 RepID=A0ABY8HGX0_ENSAD|nr:hypothetical protein [Ensifer adhaerens]WFP91352.1 hypothetical protein P4B07_02940 [Ensifer adhaerens]
MTDIVNDEERQNRAKAARERFERATSDMASEGRFADAEGMSEIEMMEYATRLQQEARK